MKNITASTRSWEGYGEREAISLIWDVSTIWCNVTRGPPVSHQLWHSQRMQLYLELISFNHVCYLPCLCRLLNFPSLVHRYCSFWSSLKWSLLCSCTHSKNTQHSPNSTLSISHPLYTLFLLLLLPFPSLGNADSFFSTQFKWQKLHDAFTGHIGIDSFLGFGSVLCRIEWQL